MSTENTQSQTSTQGMFAINNELLKAFLLKNPCFNAKIFDVLECLELHTLNNGDELLLFHVHTITDNFPMLTRMDGQWDIIPDLNYLGNDVNTKLCKPYSVLHTYRITPARGVYPRVNRGGNTDICLSVLEKLKLDEITLDNIAGWVYLLRMLLVTQCKPEDRVASAAAKLTCVSPLTLPAQVATPPKETPEVRGSIEPQPSPIGVLVDDGTRITEWKRLSPHVISPALSLFNNLECSMKTRMAVSIVLAIRRHPGFDGRLWGMDITGIGFLDTLNAMSFKYSPNAFSVSVAPTTLFVESVEHLTYELPNGYYAKVCAPKGTLNCVTRTVAMFISEVIRILRESPEIANHSGGGCIWGGSPHLPVTDVYPRKYADWGCVDNKPEWIVDMRALPNLTVSKRWNIAYTPVTLSDWNRLCDLNNITDRKITIGDNEVVVHWKDCLNKLTHSVVVGLPGTPVAVDPKRNDWNICYSVLDPVTQKRHVIDFNDVTDLQVRVLFAAYAAMYMQVYNDLDKHPDLSMFLI